MKLKIPFSIEIRGVGRNKAEAGDAVAKLMIHELYVSIKQGNIWKRVHRAGFT